MAQKAKLPTSKNKRQTAPKPLRIVMAFGRFFTSLSSSSTLQDYGQSVYSFLPAFQRWKILPHHAFIFFLCHGLGHVLVDLVHKLRAEFDHLFHSAVIGEGTVLVAIHAVFFVFAAVGIGAEHLIG